MNLVRTSRTATSLNLYSRVALQSFQFFVHASSEALDANSELSSRLQYVLRMNGRRENVSLGAACE